MTDDREHELKLRQHFAHERARDATRAPAFAAMMAGARRDLGVNAPESAISGSNLVLHAPGVHRTTSRRLVTWGAPLLVAAGLAMVVLRPDSAADREFEALVAQWSRTSVMMQQSPTDHLLSLPGSEFLRGTPSVGPSRIRRPS